MDKIVLTWPNVSLTYMDHKNGMACYQVFRELENGQYGYRLTVGQQMQSIRYHGTNYDIFVQPKVLEIRQEGLVVTHLLQEEGKEPILCPWQKELPNGGAYKLRDLYIVPCEHLYEKNRLADVLAGNVREEEPCMPARRDDVRRPDHGIFWRHGGRRTTGDYISQANLHNFVKLGQQSIFESEGGIL